MSVIEFEERAAVLLDAYRLGTPEAMERHYALTWHRRAWPAMRTYVQLDLGKRPAHPGDDVEITLDDARQLIAMEHGFANWEQLRTTVEAWPADVAMTATPVRVRTTDSDESETIVATRDWQVALRELAARPGAVLEANGQMTDEVLERVSRISHLEALSLGGSKALTDGGIRHLARLPRLRRLDLSGTGVTDDGLGVLRDLPALEALSLVMTGVTDVGVAHVRHCRQLRRLNLMWTATGDGAIRALANLERFTHFVSGNNVTDRGLAALHDVPAFAAWRGGAVIPPEEKPNDVVLRGPFTDAGMESLRGLDGLYGLALNDCAVTARGMAPLVSLPHLGSLSVDPDDAWMPYIAEMPALRSLGAQDTVAGDDGFVALSKSRTIERIWGRRCHNLRTRGFVALRQMPALRNLAVSCLNVGDEGVATLPEFPALRELMPMDVQDSGYRHVGRCANLEVLTLMYCRDTTDAATEQITGLSHLRRYFNSYTTITDRTPELLASMNSLEEVTFSACNNLTDNGVARLARLPRLRKLDVSGTALTPAVAEPFTSRVIVRYSP